MWMSKAFIKKKQPQQYKYVYSSFTNWFSIQAKIVFQISQTLPFLVGVKIYSTFFMMPRL
jgi:hypothetical protein